MKKQLTKIQLDTLNYIQKFFKEKEYTPTLADIANYFKITIRASFDRVGALIKKGYLEREKGARTLRIVSKDFRDDNFIPLLGKISAGLPIEAPENIESFIPIKKEFFPKGEYFALNVKGDSMINAGVFDGDILIVKKQNFAQNKDIVVAMLDGETTVKRIFFEHNIVVLQPENPEYEKIIRKYVVILGKVIGLIRRY